MKKYLLILIPIFLLVPQSVLAQSGDMSESGWVNTGASLSFPYCSGLPAPVIGNYVYLFGGDRTIPGSTNGIHRAPISNPLAWSDTGAKLANGPTGGAGLYDFGFVSIGDYIYILGGMESTVGTVRPPTGWPTGWPRSKAIYRAARSNPLAWTYVGDLPNPITSPQVAVVGDYVYIFGGYHFYPHPDTTIYRAPISNPTSWSDTGAVLPVNLRISHLAIIGDFIYLFGGYVDNGGSNIILRAPVSNPTAWSNVGATLPTPLGYSSVAQFDTYIYLLGGYSASAEQWTNKIYRAPLANPTSWTTIGQTLPARLAASSYAVINGYAYLFGGRTANSYSECNSSAIYRTPVTPPNPTVTAINPASGVNSASVSVTSVIGTNFISGATVNLTRSGQTDKSCTGFTFTGSTQLSNGSCPITGAAVGQWNVVVTNPDATTGTLANGFTVSAPPNPTVTAINPASGVNSASVSVTSVIGTNFISGATVKLTRSGQTDKSCTGFTFTSATQLSNGSCPITGAAVGQWNVVVTRPDALTGTLTNGFTVSAPPNPTVTAINPASGVNSASVSVTSVTGTNFISGATVKLTRSGQTDKSCTGFTFTSATQLSNGSCPITGAAVGQWNVVVTRPDALTGTLTNGFTVSAPPNPTVTAINPASGVNSASVSVTSVTGTNFISGATVKLTRSGQTDKSCTGFTFTSATQLSNGSCPITGAAVGQWNVVVTRPDALTGTLANGFTVSAPPNPTVTAINPASGVNSASVSVTSVTGTNFISGATVKLTRSGQTDKSCTGFTFTSATQLSNGSCPITGAAVGQWNVVVTRPDALTGTLANGFTVSAPPNPTVTAINPASGVNSASVSVTSVTGTNFISGATVKLTRSGQTDKSCTGFTFTSATQLSNGSCPITGAAVGQWNVVVTRPDALTGTLTNGFTVSAPASCTFDGSPVAHGSSVTAYQLPSVPFGEDCGLISETRNCTNGTLSGSFSYASCMAESFAACPFSGYAWSDTVGWISLRGFNYGFQMDTSGIISGFAWSDHIGWIQAGGLSGFPSGSGTVSANATVSGTSVTGWLKALAGGTAQSGGWDGWVSLSGTSPVYGITRNATTGDLSGHAWGDINLGWVSFAFAKCSNACTPSTSYTCSFDNNVVKVDRDSSCAETYTDPYATCTGHSFCSPGSAVCLTPSPTFNEGSYTTGHLQVRPSLITPGGTVKLFWDVGNVDDCTVTGTNGDYWDTTAAGTGGVPSSAINRRTTFTLHCNAYDGAYPATVDEQVTVSLVPDWKEI